VKEDMKATFQADTYLNPCHWAGYQQGWKAFVNLEDERLATFDWFIAQTLVIDEPGQIGWHAGFRAAKDHFTLHIAA
jgi:hypothetical protein